MVSTNRPSAPKGPEQFLTPGLPVGRSPVPAVPVLWHVLHEGVLRHVVGSPAIMREQLDKLAELAREPGVVIQILPFKASDHPGDGPPILVYDFDGVPAWHTPNAKAEAGS
jgi:Domain of unknown function (DUF5753)